MSDYFWLEFADRPLRDQYPAWAEGVDLWREYIGGDVVAFQTLLDLLVARRATVTWGVAGTELSRPRLFVSHRKDDDQRARDVATLAKAEGFQVWVDVLDRDLQRIVQASTGTPADRLLIALCIEMALLNSTHVLALITTRTRGSYWVPYEYGRAKDSSPHSLRAAAWIDQPVVDEPEYVDLGVKTRSDDEIRRWLRGELAAWNQRFPPSTPVTQVSLPGPHHLTPEELDAIAKPFRDGLGIEIQALPRATFRKRNPTGDEGPMLLVTERDITVKGIRLKKRNDP